MKRIILIALLLFVGRESAWAGACEVNLGNAFTPAQQTSICTKFAPANFAPTGNVTIGGTLGVTGATTLTGGVTGNLKLNTVSAKIIPGATSMVFRDAADANTNWTWADAGGLTQNTGSAVAFNGNVSTAGTVTSSRATDIGWSVVAAPNQACNTTCTSACVTGIDTLGTGGFLACATATADFCLCAGAS